MSEFLKTQRLRLRSFLPEDLEAVYAWRNDAPCAKFQRWTDTTRESIRAYLARHLEDVFPSEKEEQHYAIADASGETVGELAFFYNPEDRCVTLGITIGPKHQGQGLATEMLSAVIGRTREAYPAMDIVALIHPENRASIRLFDKLGFQLECYAESIESCVYTIFAGNGPNGT